MKSPWSKERRRAIQQLELIARRTPLSTVQRQRLTRASEALKSLGKGSTSEVRRRAFLVVAEISALLIEVGPSGSAKGFEPRN
jgi:hypothetical protein